MSRALQISLMLLTASLCVVCVLQWQRETQSAAREQSLASTLQDAQLAVEAQTSKLGVWEEEITRLNAALSAQTDAQKSQAGIEAELAAANRQLEAKTDTLTKLSTAGETLRSQLQKALDERDALARRLNERTTEFNALAAKLRQRP